MPDLKEFEPYQANFDKIGRDKNNIILTNNFIEKDHLEMIIKYLDSQRDNPDFSGGKDIRQGKVLQENPEVYNLIKLYEEKIYNFVVKNYCDKYDIKVKKMPVNDLHFVKWVPEMISQLHCDCQKPDGTPAWNSNFYMLSISCLMYPNDDYVGGHIKFPDYDVDIKPTAGDLIMFPSNNYYNHTVTEVISGLRFTMPMWFTFDVEMPKAIFNEQHSVEASAQLWYNDDQDTSHVKHY